MGFTVLRGLSFFGLFLCGYALYVEYKVAIDPNYVASCDLASWISCSKVFSSEYAHIFYFPNAAYGACFYLLVMILDAIKLYKYIVYLCGLTFFSTIYLAYVLAFILKDMCVVCVSTYILNFTMFFVSRYYAKAIKKKPKDP